MAMALRGKVRTNLGSVIITNFLPAKVNTCANAFLLA